MIAQTQLEIKDIFDNCQRFFEEDKPEFLRLLEDHIDLESLIPPRFWTHFYASAGRPREYSLTSLLWALIIQRIFSIPTDSLLLVFLNYSKELRDFADSKAFLTHPNSQDSSKTLLTICESFLSVWSISRSRFVRK